MKKGDVIFCKDGERYLVVEQHKDIMLVNLNTYEVINPQVTQVFINQYHRGIACILDSIYEL